jgi:hypothetical protein
MHLIIIIALGIFGGLWLFTRWAEWHAGARERALWRAWCCKQREAAKAARRTLDHSGEYRLLVFCGLGTIVVGVAVIGIATVTRKPLLSGAEFGFSATSAAPDIRGLIDQSRKMGASDDQIRDLMVKAPFLQDTWQASDEAGISHDDVFRHFGIATPQAAIGH